MSILDSYFMLWKLMAIPTHFSPNLDGPKDGVILTQFHFRPTFAVLPATAHYRKWRHKKSSFRQKSISQRKLFKHTTMQIQNVLSFAIMMFIKAMLWEIRMAKFNLTALFWSILIRLDTDLECGILYIFWGWFERYRRYSDLSKSSYSFHTI